MSNKYTAGRFSRRQTPMTIVFALMVWYALYEFFPDHLFRGFFLIPAAYWLLGQICICFFERIKETDEKKLFHLYMGAKVVKFFFTLTIMAVVTILGTPRLKAVLLVILLFHCVTTIQETIFLSSFEMSKHRECMKNKKKKETKDE